MYEKILQVNNKKWSMINGLYLDNTLSTPECFMLHPVLHSCTHTQKGFVYSVLLNTQNHVFMLTTSITEWGNCENSHSAQKYGWC